jgi:hypothetical protein
MRTETARPWVVVVIAGGVLGVLLLVLSGRSVWDSTGLRMQRLFEPIELYYWSYGEYPRGSMAEVVRTLQAPPARAGHPDGMPLLGELRTTYRVGAWYCLAPQTDAAGNYLDSWGRPIELTIVPEEHRIRMRSLGENGRDEGGEGDDIVMEDLYPPPGSERVPFPYDMREREGPYVVAHKKT